MIRSALGMSRFISGPWGEASIPIPKGMDYFVIETTHKVVGRQYHIYERMGKNVFIYLGQATGRCRECKSET